MNKEDMIIGVHGTNELAGGHYNVLGSFTVGLLKGFQNNGVKAYTTKECFENNLIPNLTIGFNVTGYETWSEYLRNNITNIMWSVDSIFAHNFEVMREFSQNPNFVLFSITPCDKGPLGEFFPNLKQAYFPHATDLELWKKQDVKKEHDIVLFSSVRDYEQMLEELKQANPEPVFNMMKEMYNVSMENPTLSFWDIYQLFRQQANFYMDVNQYVLFFRSISNVLLHAKKAQTVQKLSKFNLKVFGDGPWEKYVSGNAKYFGACDLLDSIDVMNKSKIALHPHSMQSSLGLHERVLNASAVETFVVSSENLNIQEEFGDNMAYFNNKDFCDLEEKVEYFLKNDEERITKAKNSREIVAYRHTWDVRAKQIMNIIN